MFKKDSNSPKIKDISFINSLKSIAIIGPSKKRDYFFLRNHAEYFKGPVYAVHPKVKQIPNFNSDRIYPSIMDIPGEVDFAFIAVPSSKILDIIDECVKKKSKISYSFYL